MRAQLRTSGTGYADMGTMANCFTRPQDCQYSTATLAVWVKIFSCGNGKSATFMRPLSARVVISYQNWKFH